MTPPALPRRGAGTCVRCYAFDRDRDHDGLCEQCRDDEPDTSGLTR